MLISVLLRRLRLGVLAPLALVPVFALVPASSAMATSGVKCANSSSYGSSCINIHGSGLQMTDLEGFFVPPNRDYLSHRRWALELTRYVCDPIGKPRSQCSPSKQKWFTKIRRGNPPKNGQTCVILAPEGVGYQQCVDDGVAYASANFGDFGHFYRMPHQFGRSLWFCTELVVRAHHRWHHNGGSGLGVRGCAQVHD